MCRTSGALAIPFISYRGLTAQANLCRASGAGPGRLRESFGGVVVLAKGRDKQPNVQTRLIAFVEH